MIETYKNKQGILKAVTRHWEAPQIPCDEIPQEHIDFENYRPVVDDDAEEYIPMSER